MSYHRSLGQFSFSPTLSVSSPLASSVNISQFTANVRYVLESAMKRYPSTPGRFVAEALSATVARLPEADRLKYRTLLVSEALKVMSDNDVISLGRRLTLLNAARMSGSLPLDYFIRLAAVELTKAAPPSPAPVPAKGLVSNLLLAPKTSLPTIGVTTTPPVAFTPMPTPPPIEPPPKYEPTPPPPPMPTPPPPDPDDTLPPDDMLFDMPTEGARFDPAMLPGGPQIPNPSTFPGAQSFITDGEPVTATATASVSGPKWIIVGGVAVVAIAGAWFMFGRKSLTPNRKRSRRRRRSR